MPTNRCGHARMEPLGRDGDATFDLCLACGSVFVSQRGRTWTIPVAASDEVDPNAAEARGREGLRKKVR